MITITSVTITTAIITIKTHSHTLPHPTLVFNEIALSRLATKDEGGYFALHSVSVFEVVGTVKAGKADFGLTVDQQNELELRERQNTGDRDDRDGKQHDDRNGIQYDSTEIAQHGK